MADEDQDRKGERYGVRVRENSCVLLTTVVAVDVATKTPEGVWSLRLQRQKAKRKLRALCSFSLRHEVSAARMREGSAPKRAAVVRHSFKGVKKVIIRRTRSKRDPESTQ